MKKDQIEEIEGRIKEYSNSPFDGRIIGFFDGAEITECATASTPEFADQIKIELNKLVCEPTGIDHLDAEIEIYNLLHAQTIAIMSDESIPYATQSRAAKITQAQGSKVGRLIKAVREKL